MISFTSYVLYDMHCAVIFLCHKERTPNKNSAIVDTATLSALERAVHERIVLLKAYIALATWKFEKAASFHYLNLLSFEERPLGLLLGKAQ